MTERTDETPAADASMVSSEQASVRSRKRRRWFAGSALALVVVALIAVYVMRDDSHTYSFIFENAGQLVWGDQVHIGGTSVGEVKAIELTDDGLAEVTVTVPL